MTTMRVALAQLNPTVGDIDGNAQRIQRSIAAAKSENVDLVVFPELAVVGYPPKDLLLKPAFIQAARAAVDAIAKDCHGITAVVGFPAVSEASRGRTLQNAAAWCADGRVGHVHAKSLLPTYDVFDELRYFEPGPPDAASHIVAMPDHQGVTRSIGVSICEDLWNDERVFERPIYHDNPISRLVEAGAEIILNASASPFVVGKHDFRLGLIQAVAQHHGRPIVYVNQVGGNDEIVFDGNSCVIGADGAVLAHGKAFEEDLIVVDLPEKSSGTTRVERDAADATERTGASNATVFPGGNSESDLHDVYRALVLGTRDYFHKCGFKEAVIALSGGIDSALTAVILAAALGTDHVTGVGLPSRHSSDHSRDDARELAERLSLKQFHMIPLAPAHQAIESMLAEVFAGLKQDVTEENIQARLRGVIMMALSNKTGALLATTGNKSELAVGYCTLYGDMCGGLAVISDVPKTMVFDLCRWINHPDSAAFAMFGGPAVPENTITKPPSAELRPDQLDQDSLPPYEVLDPIIERYVELDQSPERIIRETGFDDAVVRRMIRLIDLSEYKRRQAAPGLKITNRAFGFGRRMPIAQRWRG